MRLRRLARAALAEKRVTPELADARAEQLASFTHFLDIPILLLIVSLGALRPSDWTQFVIGIVIAVAVASLLNYFIPRLYPWGGEEDRPPCMTKWAHPDGPTPPSPIQRAGDEWREGASLARCARVRRGPGESC
jgi:hypothetical protein